FFFQAEDGIRDRNVTGVQTCALPILSMAAAWSLRASTTTLARIIADELTAAVSFNDHAAAIDTLNALRAEPSVVGACVYSGTNFFAEQLRDSSTAPCPPSPARDSGDRNLEMISTPIELKGKEIGTVQLRATMGPAYAHLRW